MGDKTDVTLRGGEDVALRLFDFIITNTKDLTPDHPTERREYYLRMFAACNNAVMAPAAIDAIIKSLPDWG